MSKLLVGRRDAIALLTPTGSAVPGNVDDEPAMLLADVITDLERAGCVTSESGSP